MATRKTRFVLVLALSLVGCGRPPQIGDDAETFKTVDALYTAVSLRDPMLLARCETRLRTLRNAGKLPPDASRTLDGIVTEARAGSWEPAQGRLGTFMRGQTR